MALSACRECNAQISDKAVTCPQCGRPLPCATETDIQLLAKKLTFQSSRWVAGMIFWAGAAWIALPILTGAEAAAVSGRWGLSKWMLGIGAGWYILAEIERNLYERRSRKTKPTSDQRREE